jgi:hypothetical protein
MADPRPAPALDRAVLEPVVRRLLASPTAEVLDWECSPLGYQQVWQTTAGIHLVHGSALDRGARRSWRLVLKIACAPPHGQEGGAAGTVAPGSTDYWKREAELFRDGVLAGIRGDFAPPACYGVDEPDPDTAWIWLEHVDQAVGPDWPLQRFALAARHLGRFSGRYLLGEPVPDHPSFCRPNYLRPHMAATHAGRAGALAPEVWTDPPVRAVFPPDAEARYRRVFAAQAALLDQLDRLPRVFVHRDPFRNNLIARRLPDGREQTVALDWALSGPGHLGEDLWKFVFVTLLFLRAPCAPAELDLAAFAGYVAGLRDAGWDGDARIARLGYCAHAALWVLPVLDLDWLRKPDVAAWVAGVLGRSADEVRAAIPDRSRLTLERGEEALALMGAPG